MTGARSDGGTDGGRAGADLAGLDLFGVDLSGWNADLSRVPDLAKPRTGIAPTGTWTAIASPADTLSGTSNQPDLTLYQGRPAMAWLEGTQVRVASWDGTSWTLVGGALGNSVSTTAASSPLLDGSSGTLHVGFFQHATTTAMFASIYVYRWSSAWTALGTPVDQGLTFLPDLALAVDSTGEPIVSWTSQVGGLSGHSEIVAQRFDGTGWSAYGAGLHAEGAASSALSAHIAIDHGDHLYSAWQESFVHVYEGTAGTFAPVGASSGKISNGGASFETRLAVDSQNRPVVGWMESDGTASGIYVKRWSGADWATLVTPALSAQPGNTNSQIGALTTDGVDAPVVVWTEPDASAVTRLYVARISAGIGTILGSGLTVPSGYQYLSSVTITVDEDDVPMIAFAAQNKADSTYKVFVYQYK